MSPRFPPVVSTFLQACKLDEQELLVELERAGISEALFAELLQHAYYDHRVTDAWGDKKEAERQVEALLRRFVEAETP
ncbi:MAG: hypothetical protein IPN01_02570 [Deltaproteobacteria bacterium]|jgi:hypothetical protein|nr:hypothetical protein [Deltaproteobacteria bacterium]